MNGNTEDKSCVHFCLMNFPPHKHKKHCPQCWFESVNYIGPCHLPLQGLDHVLMQLLAFNTPSKESMVESRNETFCIQGLPSGARDKEPACQHRRCKRLEFDPWVGMIPWRRAWQPTPVFLPGEPHGQRSLAGYNPWGHRELDKTEVI